MKKILFAFLLSLTGMAHAQKITTFILVRHAEKASDGTKDPDLAEEGAQRAVRLAQLLEKNKVDAIFSTNFKRTRNTVVPLAKQKNLEIQTYEPFKPEVVEAWIKQFAGRTVVVSGHSNTTPWLANLLSGNEDYKDFDDSDYGNILVVTVVEKGKSATVTWLRY